MHRLPTMLRAFSISSAVIACITTASLSPAPSRAQGVDQTLQRIDALQQLAAARQRAVNLARNTVVKLNGGLTKYMPAACMFAPSGGSCLVQQNSQGFYFRFSGGVPGWQQLGTPASLSSEIQISPDGRSVVQLIYNGVPR